MKKLLPAILIIFFSGVSAASAATSELYDWGFNIDGTTYCESDPNCDFAGQQNLPASVNIDNFDFNSGLGTIVITISEPAIHSVVTFFDHDIDFPLNNSNNETGAAQGTPATGQTWEIDEPGFGSLQNGSAGLPYYGDIFDNFLFSDLDNQVFFDAIDNQTLTPPDEVSMAEGWDFELAAGETATITLILSDTTVPSGFHLRQTDPDSAAHIYFSSFMDISGTTEDPKPDIKANGSDDPVIISQGDTLTVSIALDPGSHTGVNSDWLLYLFYYDPVTESWTPIPLAAFQSPLIDLPLTDILNTSTLPAGIFLFIFGVDMNPNDVLDEPLYIDFVIAAVQ